MNYYQRFVKNLNLTEAKKVKIRAISKTVANIVGPLVVAILIIYLLGLTYRWTFQAN
jgi:hypothetical protein